MTHSVSYFEVTEPLPRTAYLPRAVPQDNLTTGQVASGLVESVGAVYNYYGTRQLHPRRTQFYHRGKYVGDIATRVTSPARDTRVDSAGNVRVTARNRVDELRAQVDALKALRGAWGKLWRRRISDDEMSYKRCRLLLVEHTAIVDHAERVAEVSSLWETDEIAWRSAEPEIVSGSATPGVWLNLSAENRGELSIRDAIVRVSGNISAVEVAGDGYHWRWNGTLLADHVLTVESGPAIVTTVAPPDPFDAALAADAYSGFQLASNHALDDWIVLNRGANMLQAKVTGSGPASVSVEYTPLWP